MHMFPFRKYKRKVGIWFSMLLTAILLVGCGKKVSWPSEEELAALQYMEKMEVEDYYGDGAYYEAYVPKGSSNEDGSVSYFDHGIIYFASACGLDSTSDCMNTWMIRCSIPWTTGRMRISEMRTR